MFLKRKSEDIGDINPVKIPQNNFNSTYSLRRSLNKLTIFYKNKNKNEFITITETMMEIIHY